MPWSKCRMLHPAQLLFYGTEINLLEAIWLLCVQGDSNIPYTNTGKEQVYIQWTIVYVGKTKRILPINLLAATKLQGKTNLQLDNLSRMPTV